MFIITYKDKPATRGELGKVSQSGDRKTPESGSYIVCETEQECKDAYSYVFVYSYHTWGERAKGVEVNEIKIDVETGLFKRLDRIADALEELKPSEWTGGPR